MTLIILGANYIKRINKIWLNIYFEEFTNVKSDVYQAEDTVFNFFFKTKSY